MINQLYLVNAKSVIAGVYQLCDEADIIGAPQAAGFTYEGTSLNTRSVFMYALTQYFLYLTVSDRKIRDEEVELLNALLNWSFTKQEIKEVIKNGSIYSPQFISRTPDILLIMMKVDEMTQRIGLNPHATNLLIEAFNICSETIIRVDGKEDDQETIDYRTYISNLRRRANQR